jgi:hypothetical protein
MKVRCLYNRGEDLRSYEYKALTKNEFGRFGASGNTEYGEIEIGQEYLVMGMIMFQSYLSYLVDDNGFISACPCQLFEVIDDRIDSDWHFRLIEKDEDIYPHIQAIMGYRELCSDKKSYENLIIERDEEATLVYFRRKMEVEKTLENKA